MTNYKPADILIASGTATKPIPVWMVAGPKDPGPSGLTPDQQTWIKAAGFKGQSKRVQLLPGSGGELDAVLFGLGEAKSGDPAGPPCLLAGILATALPEGTYRYEGEAANEELAAIAWGLGAYRFRRYKASNANAGPACLELSPAIDRHRVLAIVESVWLARDLINTPAGDMGPVELEEAARQVAGRFGAEITSIVGEDLLTRNFPLIHAVGRASTRPPRLIDIVWGRPDAPKVTLVGKGICFDTGGLDIKPSSGMLTMKKDMGGAATALALGQMIMALGINVRLRVVLPMAENAVSGNAFRPLDIIKARSGTTVEIGNTDAEGRLVLADALALADEEKPEMMVTFATLTGAARVAMGPELTPFFCDDDALAEQIATAGDKVGDPLWRMPFWNGYDAALESDIADINNISDMGSAGAIIAALFLRRFVTQARYYAHFDIYGWLPKSKPLGPKGGEAQAARAMLDVIAGFAARSRTQQG